MRKLEAENVRLRERLMIAHAEFNVVFEHGMIGIALLNEKRELLKANERFLKFLGYDSAEEVQQLGMREMHLSQESYDDFSKYYDRLKSGENVGHFVSRLRRKNGTPVWLDLVGRKIPAQNPLDNGNDYLWVAYDLTEIQEAHQKLKRTHAELEGFFNNSMIGVLVLRGGRTVHRVNQRMADIIGAKTTDELRGKSISEFHLSQEMFEEFGKTFFNALVDRSLVQVEYQIRRLDGKPIWVTVSGKALDENDPPDLTKGVIWMVDDITDRKEAEEELAQMATTDALTGVRNRHSFMELSSREFSIYERHGRPLSVLMLDLDHFKTINDTYGHATGDEALTYFATICTENLRAADLIARLGGEEFAIVLPDTDMDQARQVAERIRESVEQKTSTPDSPTPALTVTIGVATATGDADLEQVMRQADKALYKMKCSGRNQVGVYTP